VDRGKGKMIEPEKPKKSAPIPLQTGGAFKIYKPTAQVSPAPPAAQPVKKSSIEKKKKKKKPAEMPPREARMLKLVDEDEVPEVQQPLKAAPRPVPKVSTPVEESKVEVIEAPLVKKRKLTKAVEAAASQVDEAQNVANFLATQRKRMPMPSMPRIANIKAFLANRGFFGCSG
jgi:hypothetical protein